MTKQNPERACQYCGEKLAIVSSSEVYTEYVCTWCGVDLTVYEPCTITKCEHFNPDCIKCHIIEKRDEDNDRYNEDRGCCDGRGCVQCEPKYFGLFGVIKY